MIRETIYLHFFKYIGKNIYVKKQKNLKSQAFSLLHFIKPSQKSTYNLSKLFQMKALFKIFFILVFSIPLYSIPINDTSILKEVLLVTERTIDETVLKHPYILMLYYDKRDYICQSFYYEFLKLRPLIKEIHPDLKLGIFEMSPTMKTAEKLRIHTHPHIKLFIHGVENEHLLHPQKVFSDHQEIFQWTKSEIFRMNAKETKTRHLHQNIKLIKISNSSNISAILASATAKVIFCSQEKEELELEQYFGIQGHNTTEFLQKLKQAFFRHNAKFFIAPNDFELCLNNYGKILVYGSHRSHPPMIFHPKFDNIREITKNINLKTHHHIFFSKQENFMNYLWKSHKKLLLLFINDLEKNKEIVEEFELVCENHHYSHKFQLAVVDFKDSHGKTLFERFHIDSKLGITLMITHDISHKSKKYTKIIEGNNNKTIFIEFIEKYLNKQSHEHRKYKSKRMIVKESHPFYDFQHFIHLSAEDFSAKVEENKPMIVFFYYKNIDFEKIMTLYENILEHMHEEYEYHFNLGTLDLFHNEIDNIGYYNIDRMPAVFLYLNKDKFLDITNISHTHDIQNILYQLEKLMTDKKIKYHSAKKIKAQITERSSESKTKKNKYINIKNEL